MKLTIFTDGGSRGNPGPAACAFVVVDNNEILYKEGVYLGIATNNQAEYQGLISALDWLKKYLVENKVNEIVFNLDSELVVNQINGTYKVKDEKIKIKFQEAKTLIEQINIDIINFKSVPRSQNSQADKLVNQTLDANL